MPPLSFPATAQLTDFLDIPGTEYPLSESGRWAEYGRFPFIGNSGVISTGTEFAVNGMYWTPQVFNSGTEGTIEIWACTPDPGLGAANESQRLALWLGTPNSGIGYLAGWGGGIGETFFVRRYDDGDLGTWTTLGDVGFGGFHQMLGLRITPTHVQQWGFDGATWTIIQEFADATHRGVFFAALEAESQGCTDCVGFTCFGGGQIIHSEFFRWLFN